MQEPAEEEHVGLLGTSGTEAIALQENLPSVYLQTADISAVYRNDGPASVHGQGSLHNYAEIKDRVDSSSSSILHLPTDRRVQETHHHVDVGIETAEDDRNDLLTGYEIPLAVPRGEQISSDLSTTRGRFACRAKAPTAEQMEFGGAGGNDNRIYQNDMTGRMPSYYNQKISPVTPTNRASLSSRSSSSKESPYDLATAKNWEVHADHVKLFHKIGGGSFGQVWKGNVLDADGDGRWTPVAIKMLKGTVCYDTF